MSLVLAFLSRWVMSPIGKIFGIAFAVLIFIGSIYKKGRNDARNKIEKAASDDVRTRVGDAVAAGDRVDTSPERLREDDGHRRD